jgi:hypothetical protein
MASSMVVLSGSILSKKASISSSVIGLLASLNPCKPGGLLDGSNGEAGEVKSSNENLSIVPLVLALKTVG